MLRSVFLMALRGWECSSDALTTGAPAVRVGCALLGAAAVAFAAVRAARIGLTLSGECFSGKVRE